MRTKLHNKVTQQNYGFRTIANEENCPSVRVRVWFRVSIRIRAQGNLPRGNCPRT